VADCTEPLQGARVMSTYRLTYFDLIFQQFDFLANPVFRKKFLAKSDQEADILAREFLKSANNALTNIQRSQGHYYVRLMLVKIIQEEVIEEVEE